MTTTAIKEKPILFSSPMVKAILAGTKTQTRRVLSSQPDHDKLCGPEWYEPTVVDRYGEEREGKPIFGVYSEDGEWGTRCPYEVGDRLWVRETWCEYGDGPIYRADYGRFTPISDGIGGPWRPSIFMPRRFSRITLEITEVRVQRIQEINDEDCYAEGCVTQNPDEPQVDFQELWDSLNAKRGHGWSQNPWVWAISFRRATEQ